MACGAELTGTALDPRSRRPSVEKIVDGQIKRVLERIYLKAPTKRKAIREKNEIMATINHSKYVVQSQMNFGNLLDYYLK